MKKFQQGKTRDWAMLSKQPEVTPTVNRSKAHGPFCAIFLFSNTLGRENVATLIRTTLQDSDQEYEMLFRFGKSQEITKIKSDRSDFQSTPLSNQIGSEILIVVMWSPSRHVLNQLNGRLKGQGVLGYFGFLFFEGIPSLAAFLENFGSILTDS